MRVYFFGKPEKQLLGVYHPPQTALPRKQGVVLCYPLGHEYVNARRTFRVLASRLARSGFHVLRFDYFGTGDSAGDEREGNLGQWTQDVRAAMDELRESQGVQSVSLVGLRLGATIAALAADERPEVDRVVLWEPIADGKKYVEDIKGRHQAWLETELELRPEAAQYVGAEEVLGHPLTNELLAELQSIAQDKLAMQKDKRVLLILEKDDPEVSGARVYAASKQRGADVTLCGAPGDQVWGSDLGFTLARVANEAIGIITNWSSGATS